MSWINQQLPSNSDTLCALVLEQYQALEDKDAELTHLRTVELEARDAAIKQRDVSIARRDVEIERLREKLNALLANRYGASSEQIPDEQLRLFNEAESEADDCAESSEADESIEVPAHHRRRGARRPLPEHLPRVEIHYELDDAERVCPKDGTTLERVSEVVSEQFEVIPARLQVLRHIRGTYACPCCRETMRTASLPAQPIPKSQAAPGLLAHLATSKYADGLPLYRQAAMWERVGVELSRGTLASWMVRCGAVVQPLINLLRERLLDSGLVQCDETTVQVLKEPGRAAESRSYMWVQLSQAPAIVLFEYAPSRAVVIPRALFEGFVGTLHTDGYKVYDALERLDENVTLAGCWAHARRRFDRVFKAAGVNPRKPWPKGQPPPAKLRQAAKGLGYIQTLFTIERRIGDKPPDERLRIRRAESQPILDKLKTWIEVTKPKVPPSLALGEAIGFLDRQWPKLIRFCDDGRLELSTNLVENAIRPFVVGRKAWMFSDSVAGAKASANLYSLVETAKANDLNPYLYLKHVFAELPKATTVEDIEALLPVNCDPDALLELAAWK